MNVDSDVQIFTVDGARTKEAVPTSLSALGIMETAHLEQWVVSHPEVLGGDVMIVATQYDRWSSADGVTAKERLDILGLDTSGQLVVVELKRGTDARIHLQAITYASLVAGFDKETLAQAHSEYLTRSSPTGVAVSTLEAAEKLQGHVGEGWDLDSDVLTRPRIVLIAEEFTAQTYTTVKWLTDLAPTLSIEMRTVNAFRIAEHVAPCIVFRRLFPVDDPTDRVLTPGLSRVDPIGAKIAERTRRARSTHVLYEHDSIPAGSIIKLNVAGTVNAAIAAQVDSWIQADTARGEAEWTRNRHRPLRWRVSTDEAERDWTPTGLAVHIIREATGKTFDALPGGDVWFYDGTNLIELARHADSLPQPDDS